MADDTKSEAATPAPQSAPALASEVTAAAPPALAASPGPVPPVAGPPADEAALDAAGRERPRFLLEFPKDPELQRLAAAFEAGNYALVRAGAVDLAERTENRAVRDAALELRRRIDPDPLVKYLLALVLGLLLFLAYFAYHH